MLTQKPLTNYNFPRIKKTIQKTLKDYGIKKKEKKQALLSKYIIPIIKKTIQKRLIDFGFKKITKSKQLKIYECYLLL